jgi:hypothetical protein
VEDQFGWNRTCSFGFALTAMQNSQFCLDLQKFDAREGAVFNKDALFIAGSLSNYIAPQHLPIVKYFICS